PAGISRAVAPACRVVGAGARHGADLVLSRDGALFEPCHPLCPAERCHRRRVATGWLLLSRCAAGALSPQRRQLWRRFQPDPRCRSAPRRADLREGRVQRQLDRGRWRRARWRRLSPQHLLCLALSVRGGVASDRTELVLWRRLADGGLAAGLITHLA